MKTADYYRHRLDLFVNREVRFASGAETVAFMSMFIRESYAKFLYSKWMVAMTVAEQNDYHDRLASETDLVHNYVGYFLQEHLPDSADFRYKLARKFKPAPVHKIDIHQNSQLYDYVLRRLGRTNDVTVAEGFPSLMLNATTYAGIEIEGDLVVRLY